MLRNAALFFAFTSVSILRGCAGEPSSSSSSPTPRTVASAPAAIAPSPVMKHVSKHECDDKPPSVASEPFNGGERAFQTTRRALLDAYYAEGLTEDDLYRAAVAGMLERVDPSMHKWNKLLSPREVGELHSEIQGEIVGVGVMIAFSDETGRATVIGVVPGSPAERAALGAGDEIISVDGKLYKGKTAMDMSGDIRGKAGDVVSLTVLRGDKLETVPIRREAVALESVVRSSLGDGVGYVHIWSFSDRTPTLLATALDALSAEGARSLVVDLRGNGGGSFDGAVASAGLLLPAGATVTTLERRGGKSEARLAKGGPKLADVPMVVLVDHGTASGAELVASALVQGRKAQLVGRPTLGKWSVQTLEPLENGYAIKFTTSLFTAATGKLPPGVGLTPDVDVDADEGETAKAGAITDPVRRLAADVQLRAAVALLRARR
jgi:carboxyl-terminal processing protease